MAEWLIVILALSVIGAAFAYWKARKLHIRIEHQYPGVNSLMRERKRQARH